MHSTPTKQPHAANRGLKTANLLAKDFAFAPHDFEATEERGTPCSDGENAAKEDYRVNADASLARPVVVGIQVEPQ